MPGWPAVTACPMPWSMPSAAARTRRSPAPARRRGTGGGLGAPAARGGARVVCAAGDRPAADITAELVAAEGATARVVVADVADPAACAAMVEESVAALGGLDGLVLNVGIAIGRGMAGTTAAQWDATFAVNARAHFLVSAAPLPGLAPRSSILFITPPPLLPSP